MNKKIFIFGTVIIILLIYYLKKMNDIPSAFKKAEEKYGRDIVNVAEKIYRLETRHFKSSNFKKTWAAGFEATKITYPFGWTSLKTFWDSNQLYKPTSIFYQKERKNPDIKGSGIVKKFVVFPSFEAGLFSLCERLKKIPSSGYYFSKKPELQRYYENLLKTINTKYVK